MNHELRTFWSPASLQKKINLWSGEQIKNFFIPFLELKPNETIYDVGSGFSPLGIQFIPYILPNGHITGFDNDDKIIMQASQNIKVLGMEDYLKFRKLDVYNLDTQSLPLVDLVMSQQLLVNVADPVTALEHMVNVTKSTGRILCVENINYGAYVHRPDFSFKTNLKLSQIWQELCIAGKNGYDFGDSTFGAKLPQVFKDHLHLNNIAWQIISSGINMQPPYSDEFKQNFLKNYTEEKQRLADLVLKDWGPKTSLTEKKINFFVENLIISDYDKYAVNNDLFLTQWFYPLMAIVGWITPKLQQLRSENVSVTEL